MVVRMVAAFWAAVNANGLAWLLAAVLVGALALLVVLLLWNGRADAWFTRS
jgi:NADH:ubiquinone oxidoreductase subunit 6 (subunit J)